MTLEVTRPAPPLRLLGPLRSLCVAAVLAAGADWLFYGRSIGVSLVIFAAMLCVALLVTNRVRTSSSTLVLATAGLMIALLPAIEHVGALSIGLALAGTMLFALVATGRFSGFAATAAAMIRLALTGPFRLANDLKTMSTRAKRLGCADRGCGWAVAWIMPIALGGVFLMLFAAANPVIHDWLSALRLPAMLRNGDPRRLLFWAAVIVLAWPLLRVRLRRRASKRVPPVPTIDVPPIDLLVSPLFSQAAILRSLVLFNALFAVQTTLDIAYLWNGVALPGGMTYASYAHRGAYPLIATAILAGAFVLAAVRPGSETGRSRLIRALVLVWTAQNILLVVSSMLRLDLYVETYALTRWRFAAFVWMLLVAIGLVLIVARMLLDRPNGWLIRANALALTLTLYVCSLTNIPGLIANFNVTHSWELGGPGEPIDASYLCGLGPDALPAIERMVAAMTAAQRTVPAGLFSCLRELTIVHRNQMQDWRAWSFRRHRLARFLQDEGNRKPVVSAPRIESSEAWESGLGAPDPRGRRRPAHSRRDQLCAREGRHDDGDREGRQRGACELPPSPAGHDHPRRRHAGHGWAGSLPADPQVLERPDPVPVGAR